MAIIYHIFPHIAIANYTFMGEYSTNIHTFMREYLILQRTFMSDSAQELEKIVGAGLPANLSVKACAAAEALAKAGEWNG